MEYSQNQSSHEKNVEELLRKIIEQNERVVSLLQDNN